MISWSCTCWAQVSFLLYELGPLRTQNDSSMKPAIGLDDPTLSFQFDDFALLNMAQGTHTHTRTNIANAFVCPENIELRQNKSHPDPLHFPVFVCFCVLFIFTLNSAWITWKILTAEALQTSFYQSCLLRLHPLSSVKIWGNMINSPRGEKQATKGTQEKIW